MSFRLDGAMIRDGDPIKIMGELVRKGIRLNGILIYKTEAKEVQNYIMGNFKMNPGTYNEHQAIMDMYKKITVTSEKKLVVFPTTLLAKDTIDQLSNYGIEVGIQDVANVNLATGAATGQTSAALAFDLGVKYALIHHSEVAQFLENKDITVSKQKLSGLLKNSKLIPVICVGEELVEREAERQQEVVESQLKTLVVDNATSLLGQLQNLRSPLIIVYEPVWAIGTGKTITPEQADEMAAIIKSYLEKYESDIVNTVGVVVAYGGTVNANNAATLSQKYYIDGALVGGAAINSKTTVMQQIYDNWIAG